MNTDNKKRSNYIRDIIQQHFEPQWMELIDESFKHQVPEGAESHFKLTLVSAHFIECTRVQRHQMVNTVLLSEFQKGLHALSLALYSPEEWIQHPTIQDSPLCHRK